MKKYTLIDVKNSYSKEKRAEDTMLGKILFRPLSNLLAYCALRVGISANTVSVLSVLTTLCACILFVFPYRLCVVVGFVFLNLFPFLDCIDGTIARTVCKKTAFGEFFDALGGYTMLAFPLLFICFRSVIDNSELSTWRALVLLLICGIGCVCGAFARLVYHRYCVSSMMEKQIVETAPYKIKKSTNSFFSVIKYVLSRFNRLISVGDGFTIILTIGFFLGFVDYLTLFFSLYNLLLAIVTVFVYIRKANSDKEKQAE